MKTCGNSLFIVLLLVLSYFACNATLPDIQQLQVSQEECIVILEWENIPGNEGYRIRRRLKTSADFVTLFDVAPNVTIAKDYAVLDLQNYVYQVRALVAGVAINISNTPEIQLHCTQSCGNSFDMKAINFKEKSLEGYIPAVVDSTKKLIGIKSELYQAAEAAIATTFMGENGMYSIQFSAVKEEGNTSDFELFINNKSYFTLTNYAPDSIPFSLHNIPIRQYDTIKMVMQANKSNTNYSHAWWEKLQFTCTNSLSNCEVFEETGGLLAIEMEDVTLSELWKRKDTLTGFSGSGYIQWEGEQYFNSTQNGRISIPIYINTPGAYEIRINMAVANIEHGTTEHNDTWIKILADDFYALKDTHLIRPKPNCTQTEVDCPNGSSNDGYFKFFGGGVNWKWQSKTSDNNDHAVNAYFSKAGYYQILLAARSNYHALDRLVLFHKQTLNATTATQLTQVAACKSDKGLEIIEVLDSNCFQFLTWNPTLNTSYYTLHRQSFFDEKLIYKGSATSIIDTTMEPSTYYTYSLNAYSDDNILLYTQQIITTTPHCAIGLEEGEKTDISFYPNPIENHIQLHKKQEWQLYSIHGQILLTGAGDTINTTALNEGVYLLQLKHQLFRVVKK